MNGVPFEAQTVLKLVQDAGATDAVVAGGCLRDFDNNRPINDIDVFVGQRDAEEAKAALVAAGYVCVKHLDDAYMTMDNTIMACDYYEKANATPVNLLTVYGRNHIDFQLERFDYGICAIGYDGKNLIKAPRYQLDQQNQTFTLKRHQTELQREYSLKRFERLSAKYPGWTLVQ